MTTIPIILAALYLRGGPRPSSLSKTRGWLLLAALRRYPCSLSDASDMLAQEGFWPEALMLQSPGLCHWAGAQIRRGVVLTAADDDYPIAWGSAPLALWREGTIPVGTAFTIVGSRKAPESSLDFCRRTAEWAIDRRMCIWSGGAVGCDRAGAEVAQDSLVTILPYGLDRVRNRPTGTLLSLAAPNEDFSTAAAMERNALLYGISSTVVIGHARYREGGTWHSAVEALRRRRSRIAIFDDDSPAVRALVALGAHPISHPEEIDELPNRPRSQVALFKVG